MFKITLAFNLNHLFFKFGKIDQKFGANIFGCKHVHRPELMSPLNHPVHQIKLILESRKSKITIFNINIQNFISKQSIFGHKMKISMHYKKADREAGIFDFHFLTPTMSE